MVFQCSKQPLWTPCMYFSAGFCIFQWVTRRDYFSHFLSGKVTLCIWGENNLVFIFAGNSINKIELICFNIIRNFLSVCTLSIINLYIFKLGFILSHSIGWELAYTNPFLANLPILYSLETPENQKASSVFRGYKIGIMARKGLIKFIIAREGPAQKNSFLLACCETEWERGWDL